MHHDMEILERGEKLSGQARLECEARWNEH